MIQITRPEDQVQLDYLTGQLQEMRRRVDQLESRGNKASEDTGRRSLIPGQDWRRVQVTSAIGPCSSSGVEGVGAGRIVVPVGGTLYLKYPHVTITGIVNDDGNNIVVNTLIYVKQIDGVWTVMWEACSGIFTAPFADQPH